MDNYVMLKGMYNNLFCISRNCVILPLNQTKSSFLFNLKALMVIAICETKEEHTDTQILFWENLNSAMQRETLMQTLHDLWEMRRCKLVSNKNGF